LSSIASAKEDGSHAQTTISNSSTIFFQPNFAGLLKLPLDKMSEKLKKMQILPQKYSDIFSDGINVYLENRKK